MKESKSLLEIGIYLNSSVKELAFEGFFHFFMDCLSNSTRLANDEEVSKILYDAIEFGGLFIPNGIHTSKFTVQSLLTIADSNFKPTYCKERLAQELNIHEQTLNNWLKAFDKPLYFKLLNERKLSFKNLYQIMVSLGFTLSTEVLKRSELSKYNCKESLKEDLIKIIDIFM